MTRILVAVLLVTASLLATTGEPALVLPNRGESVKFAVLGDNGSGDQGQDDIAAQMVRLHRLFRYEFVIMLGDNFYGGQSRADLTRKFDQPYRLLLDDGVTFHAAIGNHDDPATIEYPPLNMGGRRYYTYVRKQARFFVLDTNIMDAPQLRWIETALQEAREPWKIAYFHHPLYGNSGRHGSAVDIRVLLEPLFIRYGVDVVFSGHDHVYERLKPQKGIHYFVAGSGGKLRRGDLKSSATTAAGFDQEQAFMIVEIHGDELWFQTSSASNTFCVDRFLRGLQARARPDMVIARALRATVTALHVIPAHLPRLGVAFGPEVRRRSRGRRSRNGLRASGGGRVPRDARRAGLTPRSSRPSMYKEISTHVPRDVSCTLSN